MAALTLYIVDIASAISVEDGTSLASNDDWTTIEAFSHQLLLFRSRSPQIYMAEIQIFVRIFFIGAPSP